MKAKFALYQTKYSDSTPCEEWAEGMEEYARLTEFVEIDFPDLPKDKLIGKQLAMIEKQIEEIKTDAMSRVDHLQQRKQELLALTQQ